MVKKTFVWNPDMPITDQADYISQYIDQVLNISTPSKFIAAGVMLRKMAGLIDEVTKDFQEPKSDAHKIHKTICDSEKGIVDPLQDIYKKLKTQMLVWRDVTNANEEMQIKKLLDADPTADIPLSIIPKMPGIELSQTIAPLVSDAEQIPREFLMPDMKKIQQFVSKTGGEVFIPGIKFIKVTKMRVYKPTDEDKS